MKWFRLYSEIKDDPKMLALTDHQFRIWINLLAMASDTSERGIIPRYPMRGLAASLHTTEDQLIEALDLFASEEFNLIARQEDGSIFITKFADRQYDNPSDQPKKVNERVKKHREQKRNENKTSDSIAITTCNNNVTPSNALDTDIDTELIEDDDDNAHVNLSLIKKTEETYRPLSTAEMQFLLDWQDTFPDDVILDGVRRSYEAGKLTIGYMRKVFVNWQQQAVKSMDDVNRLDVIWESKKKSNKPRGQPQVQTSAMDNLQKYKERMLGGAVP